MPQASNVRIGACRVTYKGVNLGHTNGGVTFNYDRETVPLEVDQYPTPVDMALMGENLTVQFNLAEPQVARINVAIPEGDHVLGGSGERLNLGNDAGYQLRQDAGLLVLHPLNRADNDDSEDIQIYKAVSTEGVEIGLNNENQRLIPVTMTALVDETYGSGRRLGHIGSANVS